MTDTQALSTPIELPAPTNAWDEQFQRLRARFPGTKDTILFCVQALMQGVHVAIDDLKAQAQMHGLRITAASLNAANKLLSPQPKKVAAKVGHASAAAPLTSRGQRLPGSAPMAAGVEGLIRQVVELVQRQSDVRAATMQKAIKDALRIIDEALR